MIQLQQRHFSAAQIKKWVFRKWYKGHDSGIPKTEEWSFVQWAVFWADLLHMDEGSKKLDYGDFHNFMNKVNKTYFLLGLATV